MTAGARFHAHSRGLPIAGPIAGSILLGVAAAGFATRGLAGGLAIAGLLAVLVGLVAASLGRARWVFIGSRRTAAVVALAGVLAFLAGVLVEARTAQDADSASFTLEQSAQR